MCARASENQVNLVALPVRKKPKRERTRFETGTDTTRIRRVGDVRILRLYKLLIIRHRL